MPQSRKTSKRTAKKEKVSKTQIDEFRAKARELGCDDTAGEDEVMRRLAGQKRHEAAK
jgi:hypothetical protein